MEKSVLDELEQSIDIFAQLSLTNRIVIRLRRAGLPIYEQKDYESEDKLLQDFPIHNNKFSFNKWHALHDEIFEAAWQKKDVPNALYAYLVGCISTFEQSSELIFPGPERSQEDHDTGEILKFLAYGCGYLYAFHPSEGRRRLLHVLGDLGLISESAVLGQSVTDEEFAFIKANQADFALLYSLIDSMSYLGHIIQGVLYEVGSDKTLFQLQEECGVTLCEDLYAWKLGSMTATTTKYARQILGGNDRINVNDNKKEAQQQENAKDRTRRLQSNLAENITALCHRLKPDYIKQRDNKTWVFTGSGILYAYMFKAISDKCGFKTCSWKTYKTYIEVNADSNYLKQAAHKLKNPNNRPEGYAVIDDAINGIFK
jgi:hypothetical protein